MAISMPFGWYGGKRSHLKHLLPLVPEHEHYLEAFAGAAALFFAKTPCAGVKTINDLDGGVASFYRVLRDPDLFGQFYRMLQVTEYSRALFLECRSLWRSEEDPVKRAWRWWYVARLSFSGHFSHSMGTNAKCARRGMAKNVSSFLSTIDGLPALHERIRGAQIECMDFRPLLARYDGPGYFCYCDPPYVLDTRVGGDRYALELSDNDHADLVDCLLAYRGKVLLSGYAHPVYSPLEAAGWRRVDYAKRSSAANGAIAAERDRMESVWVSPNAQQKEQVRLW
jgi:DNA adenine methylase